MNRARVWEAINEYVRACGGDPTARVYGNTLRQNAVVDIESEIAYAESSMSEREQRLEIEVEEHAADLDAIRDVLYEQFSKGKCSELVAVGLIEKIIRESSKGSRLTEEMRRTGEATQLASDLKADRDALADKLASTEIARDHYLAAFEELKLKSGERIKTLLAALRRLLATHGRGNADTHESGCGCATHEAEAAIRAASSSDSGASR